MSQPTFTSRRALVSSVVSLTLARLVVNIAHRFPYPFLPEIARQLNVPLTSVQGVVGLQSGIGLSSPFFGPLSERFGRKRMLVSVLAFMIGMSLLGALLPQFWLFAAIMLALGLGKTIYDPAMQAYLGDRIPYHQRGRALGFTELSWAGSLIVAAPLAGFLLETATLQAVFWALAGLLAVSLVLVWGIVPADTPDPAQMTPIVGPVQAFGLLRRSPAALGSLAFTACLMGANEVMFINYGAWMEASFRLDPVMLGTATTVIALAEVVGELAVTGLADRWGKWRMALAGCVLSSVTYLALPLIGSSLPLALATLFVMFLAFEIAIVAAIPLFTEVMPQARSVMMSGIGGAAAAGRLGGVLVGSLLYSGADRFLLVSVAALIIGLLAAVALWRYVRET